MSDLISRQAAIEAVKARVRTQRSTMEINRDIIPMLENLPSAEPKKGKWMKHYSDHEAFGVRTFYRYCSECNEVTVSQYNFCPNCGADMRGEE